MRPLDPRLVRRSRAVRRYLVCGVALGLATAVAIVVQAWLIAAIVTRQFDGRPLLALPVAIAACFVVRAAIRWAHAVASARAAVSVKNDLRTEITLDLLHPRRIGPPPPSGRVIALLGPGLDAFDGYVGRFLPQLVLGSLVPGLVVVALAWVDPLSAVIVGLALPLLVVFMVLVGLVTRDRIDQRWAALERLSRHFAEVLDGLVVLKIFGRRQEEGLSDVGDRHRKASMGALRMAFLSSLVLELVSTLSVAIVAVSVGLRVLDGSMGLEPALIVLLLAPEAFAPIRQLGAMFHDSTEGAEAVGEALSILDHERHDGRLSAPDITTSDITISHLEVSAADRDRPILTTGVEVIRPREFVAIAGPSGAGKSTLLRVLLDFAPLARGSVHVGGVSLTDIDPLHWRRHIAWVPQFPTIVDGTIAANIRLGHATASDADVRGALRDAGAGDLDPSRRIREDAADVSAGERRRVAIARALLRVRTDGARLLLLDEPTAGLDPAREASVLKVIRELGVTVIVVAHHSETIAAADRVIHLRAPVAVPV